MSSRHFTNSAFEKLARDIPYTAGRAFDDSNDTKTVQDIVESPAFAAVVDDSPQSLLQIFDNDNDLDAFKAVTNSAFEKLARDTSFSRSSI